MQESGARLWEQFTKASVKVCVTIKQRFSSNVLVWWSGIFQTGFLPPGRISTFADVVWSHKLKVCPDIYRMEF